ncbi:MAG: hypothetical protein VXZ96_19945 [Myxococcota bacterium]|nr:hypothetical protein [Myxococcota bacterium]
MGSFDIQGIVTRAFDIFKDNVGLLLGLTVGGMVLGQILNGLGIGAQVVTTIAGENLDSDLRNIVLIVGGLVRIFLSFVLFVFNTYFGLAMIKISLRLIRGDTATFMDAVLDFSTFLQGLLANFLLSLAAFVGFLCCIVPGIIISIGLTFSLYLVVDQKKSAIDALKESWALTNGAKMNLFIWFIVCALIGLAGLLACFVGLFVAGPVILVGTGIIYEELSQSKTGSPLDVTQ